MEELKQSLKNSDDPKSQIDLQIFELYSKMYSEVIETKLRLLSVEESEKKHSEDRKYENNILNHKLDTFIQKSIERRSDVDRTLARYKEDYTEKLNKLGLKLSFVVFVLNVLILGSPAEFLKSLLDLL